MTEGALLDVLPLGVVVLDRDYAVRSWNRWMVTHTGIAAADMVGHTVFERYPELNKKTFVRACASALSFGNVVYLSQRLHRYLFPIPLGSSDQEREYMQQSCTITPLRDKDLLVTGLAITVLDVTDSVRLEERLRRLNNIDSLTGAHNRRFLESRLPEEIERHQRYDRSLSLFILDIDHFKVINDTHGHLTGDRVLVVLTQLVRDILRSTDHFVRFGGEEFISVLPETGRDEAMRIADRVRRHVEATPIVTDSGEVRITVSIGISQLRSHQRDPEELLQRADQALYRAKNAGRNRVVHEDAVTGKE